VQVGRDDAGVVFKGNLADEPDPLNAGVADEDVDPAARLVEFPESRGDAVRIGHVGFEPGHAVAPGFRGDFVEREHLGAVAHESRGDAVADAARAAGHYRDLTRKGRHRNSLNTSTSRR